MGNPTISIKNIWASHTQVTFDSILFIINSEQNSKIFKLSPPMHPENNKSQCLCILQSSQYNWREYAMISWILFRILCVSSYLNVAVQRTSHVHSIQQHFLVSSRENEIFSFSMLNELKFCVNDYSLFMWLAILAIREI